MKNLKLVLKSTPLHAGLCEGVHYPIMFEEDTCSELAYVIDSTGEKVYVEDLLYYHDYFEVFSE